MLDTIAPYSRYIELYLIHKFILRRGDYLIPTMQTSRPFAALVLLLAIGNCAVREHLMNKPVPVRVIRVRVMVPSSLTFTLAT